MFALSEVRLPADTEELREQLREQLRPPQRVLFDAYDARTLAEHVAAESELLEALCARFPTLRAGIRQVARQHGWQVLAG
jgi:hypothetical protein